MTQVPILTYHASNMDGMDYHNNDHVALSEDLKLIDDLGLRIIRLDELMAWHCGKAPESSVKNAVVLTCDDGTSFDYHDITHQTYGPQISFFNILKAHQQLTSQPVHMTNFVIVSPEARIILDQKCMIGMGWWGDDWWHAAQTSGLMEIANHSWDHNHGVLDNNNTNDDSFRCINNKLTCDLQIKHANEFLNQFMGNNNKAAYFAYPYGDFSEYLRHEYLPVFGPEIGLKAAFTTKAKHANKLTDRWAMPRYVCNNDWQNTHQLEKILSETR